jgi:soluble lytic murein transglycosylase
MRNPPLRTLFCTLFCLLACFDARAQATPGDPAIRDAIDAAERGQPVDAARWSRDPLYGWLEYAVLRRDIDTLADAQGQSFLDRYRGQAVAEAFRSIWLAALARRQDWPAFRSAWSPAVNDTALRCAELDARQATGAADARWTKDAQALWRSSGKSLPDACDAPFAVLAAKGGLPPELRWERIDKAAAEWQPAVMRAAARGLPADQFALANDYAAFFEAVNDRALSWPKTPRSRMMASQGLARLAKSTPVAAEKALPRFDQALGFSEEERGRVLYQAALWTVASYEPDSARRLAAVPASAYDERLHEWQVREALSRSDWKAALAAIKAMGESQRGDSRWSYFAARLSELAGDRAGAQAYYAAAARKTDFHGFLAADRLGQPYALCPWVVHDDDAAKAAVARDPALVRAIALNRIDRTAWAEREWKDALSRFDDAKRRLAIEVAQDNGWFDRGVFGLRASEKPDELRLYDIRFPIHHADAIRREAAKNQLDPAWLAAEIRAESIFNPRARSPANAMGLMQVMPATGAAVAKRIGVPYAGASSLYDSDTNIAIGSAYLRQMEDKYGQPYVAIAAYNAGPSPVARWQSQRPSMDPDFWIETISYKETRDYVARVLAFSVLYDWRMNGDALPVSQRLRGQSTGPRKQFACPPVEASKG